MNAPAGYGRVTKGLHWMVAAGFVTQFVLGYMMDADDSGRGRGRGRGRGGESGQGRGRGRGGDLDVFDDPLVTAHVIVGCTILALATIRLTWRLTTPLPPWAPGLSGVERRLSHRIEQLLYVLMFAAPASGLWLVLVDDDALAVHIATHIAFFVVVAVHIGNVLRHQLILRDGLLRRMTF
jgi:cytochrome b561